MSRRCRPRPRVSWTLSLVVALVAGLAGGCSSAPTNASSATTTVAADPAQPRVDVLPNGLTLVVQDHRAADIVAVYLWVGTGVRYETPDTLGHAHFQEHMLFKGTDKFGPGYIDRTVEGTGGRSNAFTTFDYTTYQILVPKEATGTAIQLLDDMAFRSKFDPKEIDAERKVIFEESHIETDNPRTAIVRQLHGLVFGEHPYGRPILGTPATLNAATQTNLKAFNRRFYNPENMMLVVVGPVEAGAVRTMVNRTFGAEPRTSYTPPPNPPLAPIKDIVRRTVERPEQQAHLVLGWQAPSFSDADSLPLDLLATILAGSESSRLVNTLRDREQIVTSIAMNNVTLRLAGMIYVQARLEAPDVEKVERRVLEEIARLQQEGPTEEERVLAVTKAEADHAVSYETTDGVASSYGIALMTAKLDDELRYLERLRAVSREQIRDVARKYLPLTAYARIAFVPAKTQ
ncbi:MAG TPA: pitrilysin family protein [Methylomirabilota bacterium]|jgi:zinc protease